MIYALRYHTVAYCLALLCSAESKCILIRQQAGHNAIMHLEMDINSQQFLVDIEVKSFNHWHWSFIDRFKRVLLSRFNAFMSHYDFQWVTSVVVVFYSAFFNTHRNGVLTALFGCYMAGGAWNCCRLGARPMCTIQPCHFIKATQVVRIRVFLAVTCHLHFWQNDRDHLRATAVTRGWNAWLL